MAGDCIKLGLGDIGKTDAFGKVLPQQPVGVFVAAALPRMMRIAKVHFVNISDTLHNLVKLKAAIWLGRLLSAVGLGFAALAFIYNPIIEYAQTAWSSVPAGIAAWVHTLGIDQGVSIILSAYGIRGAERIFIQRRNQAT